MGNIKYDREYLINKYEATCTDDGTGTGDIESYESWLEKQLISRLEKLDELDDNINSKNKIVDMRIGKFKGQEVSVYDSGDGFIVEFSNGSSITMSDVSDIDFDN